MPVDVVIVMLMSRERGLSFEQELFSSFSITINNNHLLRQILLHWLLFSWKHILSFEAQADCTRRNESPALRHGEPGSMTLNE